MSRWVEALRLAVFALVVGVLAVGCGHLVADATHHGWLGVVTALVVSVAGGIGGGETKWINS